MKNVLRFKTPKREWRADITFDNRAGNYRVEIRSHKRAVILRRRVPG